MNNLETFKVWLLSARKENGDYYTENTQRSYYTAFCKAANHFSFLGELSLAGFDKSNEIVQSEYYSGLPDNRKGELRASLNLYREFLSDRENGWQTIAEFSEGKHFTPTSEFSLHVTYDTPFTVKELSGFLHDLDCAYNETLLEQGFNRTEINQMDLTVAKVKEGSLWFEIASTVIAVVMPLVMFVLERRTKKHDEKKYNYHNGSDKQCEIHKNDP